MVGLFLFQALIQGTILIDKLYHIYYTASENSLLRMSSGKREGRIMQKVLYGAGLEVWFIMLCPILLFWTESRGHILLGKTRKCRLAEYQEEKEM